ncbi:hypothetical protein M885DRAFT_523260 [Pelagophyceae sp. CCMP2097]|nr:hypothetical protein M885DRAFT_523260 [Pelagophyceae sp. CCMP2097]
MKLGEDVAAELLAGADAPARSDFFSSSPAKPTAEEAAEEPAEDTMEDQTEEDAADAADEAADRRRAQLSIVDGGDAHNWPSEGLCCVRMRGGNGGDVLWPAWIVKQAPDAPPSRKKKKKSKSKKPALRADQRQVCFYGSGWNRVVALDDLVAYDDSLQGQPRGGVLYKAALAEADARHTLSEVPSEENEFLSAVGQNLDLLRDPVLLGRAFLCHERRDARAPRIGDALAIRWNSDDWWQACVVEVAEGLNDLGDRELTIEYGDGDSTREVVSKGGAVWRADVRCLGDDDEELDYDEADVLLLAGKGDDVELEELERKEAPQFKDDSESEEEVVEEPDEAFEDARLTKRQKALESWSGEKVAYKGKRKHSKKPEEAPSTSKKKKTAEPDVYRKAYAPKDRAEVPVEAPRRLVPKKAPAAPKGASPPEAPRPAGAVLTSAELFPPKKVEVDEKAEAAKKEAAKRAEMQTREAEMQRREAAKKVDARANLAAEIAARRAMWSVGARPETPRDSAAPRAANVPKKAFLAVPKAGKASQPAPPKPKAAPPGAPAEAGTMRSARAPAKRADALSMLLGRGPKPALQPKAVPKPVVKAAEPVAREPVAPEPVAPEPVAAEPVAMEPVAVDATMTTEVTTTVDVSTTEPENTEPAAAPSAEPALPSAEAAAAFEDGAPASVEAAPRSLAAEIFSLGPMLEAPPSETPVEHDDDAVSNGCPASPAGSAHSRPRSASVEAEAEATDGDLLPPGWVVKWSQRKQMYYYTHKALRLTRWTPPDEAPAADAADAAEAEPPPPAAEETGFSSASWATAMPAAATPPAGGGFSSSSDAPTARTSEGFDSGFEAAAAAPVAGFDATPPRDSMAMWHDDSMLSKLDALLDATSAQASAAQVEQQAPRGRPPPPMMQQQMQPQQMQQQQQWRGAPQFDQQFAPQRPQQQQQQHGQYDARGPRGSPDRGYGGGFSGGGFGGAPNGGSFGGAPNGGMRGPPQGFAPQGFASGFAPPPPPPQQQQQQPFLSNSARTGPYDPQYDAYGRPYGR